MRLDSAFLVLVSGNYNVIQGAFIDEYYAVATFGLQPDHAVGRVASVEIR